jgi:UDP-N-acetyl-D-glucosamine dehydrogenase
MDFEGLKRKIETRSALIGVIGLGYVGLPLSLAFSEAGVRVIGFDVDPEKPARLSRKETYLKHIEADRIDHAISNNLFSATADFERLSEVDAIIICVPTPLSEHLEPDLSYIRATAETIVRRLRRNQIVILESTTYPGTTCEVLKPMLESSGLRSGVDFWLAFSPEREDPGNPDYETATIPKVVGADDEQARTLAASIYKLFAKQVVEVSTSATAEAVKITENIFRAINIALVNELKVIYDLMAINVWEVIDAAKTKPFGYMPFYPGPGLGGHCIPIDPFYLAWKAREYGERTNFIELAGVINGKMPAYVVDKTARAIDARSGKGLNGATILLLGVAYKKNIDDVRESPALSIMRKLRGLGASVNYFDPYVSSLPKTREYAELQGLKSVEWDAMRFSKYDAVVIVTDHDGLDYSDLAVKAKLIIDTRNVMARNGADLRNVVLC